MTNITGLCVVLFLGSMLLANAVPGVIHAAPSAVGMFSSPGGR